MLTRDISRSFSQLWENNPNRINKAMLWQTCGLEEPNPNPCFRDLLITSLHPYTPAHARVAEVSHIEEADTAVSALEPREGKGIRGTNVCSCLLWALTWDFRWTWLSFLPREGIRSSAFKGILENMNKDLTKRDWHSINGWNKCPKKI